MTAALSASHLIPKKPNVFFLLGSLSEAVSSLLPEYWPWHCCFLADVRDTEVTGEQRPSVPISANLYLQQPGPVGKEGCPVSSL